MTTQPSYEDWIAGEAALVGRRLMEPLTPAVQVARAIAVLDLCRSHWSPVPAIERVALVGRNRAKWHEGHDAFDDVRMLTLLEERLRTSDVYRSLLYVAEIVAKIVYNASNSPAPFDENSPRWLPRNARDFVKSLGEPEVGRAIWDALAGVAPAGPGASTSSTELPPTWRRVGTVAVGGLTEVGFDASEDYLLVVSWQGRGVVDTVSGRKVARDGEEPVAGASWIDEGSRTVEGIGPLQGRPISCVGLWGGVLPERGGGWTMRLRSTEGTDQVFLIDEHAGTSWLVQSAITEPRAVGFSPSGRVAVVATSSDVTLYARAS